MYLESSAVITPDPADPSTYSVQDYAGMAVPWADMIRVRDGGEMIAAAYRQDNGWYSDTVPCSASRQWQTWQSCLMYQLAATDIHLSDIQALIGSGWA